MEFKIILDCRSGSLCFELTKGLPTAIVAFIVGALASYIAYQQWKATETKLKLELFEKRYAIFTAVWDFISRPSLGRQSNSLEHVVYINDFQRKIPIATFLFGSEIAEYMKEAVKKILEFKEFEAECRAVGSLSAEKNAAHIALMEWFNCEAKDGVKIRFEPYLSFKHLK